MGGGVAGSQRDGLEHIAFGAGLIWVQIPSPHFKLLVWQVPESLQICVLRCQVSRDDYLKQMRANVKLSFGK